MLSDIIVFIRHNIGFIPNAFRIQHRTALLLTLRPNSTNSISAHINVELSCEDPNCPNVIQTTISGLYSFTINDGRHFFYTPTCAVHLTVPLRTTENTFSFPQLRPTFMHGIFPASSLPERTMDCFRQLVDYTPPLSTPHTDTFSTYTSYKHTIPVSTTPIVVVYWKLSQLFRVSGYFLHLDFGNIKLKC